MKKLRAVKFIYLALYRKYRPMTFRDVFSQEHITKTLQNQIKNNQTVHAYLFTGSRGTGKTTCARIFAKALNCLAPEDGNPCLKCEACVLIETGAQDISEIDAASNNGVDDVRVLREETRYAPVSLKYRVYIIDEVHMLSAGAWAALLKTLEEPPAHVVFILATTENHKVPATILSRCQRFEFKRVNVKDCAAALIKAAETESVKITGDAAELIARLSDGGMRDALSLLETCISHAEPGTALPKEITGHIVREAAGVAGSEHVFGISEAILVGNAASALKIINTLHGQSKDMGRLLGELIRHYRNLMLLKLMPGETDLISWLPEEADDYRRLTEKYELGHIMKCLDTLEEYYERISRSRDKGLTAELCLIALCAAVPQITAAPVRQPEKPHVPVKQPEPPPMPEFPPEPPPPELPPPMTVVGLAEQAPVAVSSQWSEVLRELPAFLAGMLEDAGADLQGEAVELTGNELIAGIVANPDNKAKIAEAVLKVTGKRTEVRFVTADPPDSGSSSSEEIEQPPDKINQFKNLLKQKGIEVRER
ncbi:MAG: DNA polymerase III subunit gamma/tau [Oscillospiraceae bacterium]|jgi:DNA polymerase-3 subunit gamma/tau|nr:DNA polymerase III subunit gamma/tau [Oscillospiraceae bacterium]